MSPTIINKQKSAAYSDSSGGFSQEKSRRFVHPASFGAGILR
jgi:hypothetical protein